MVSLAVVAAACSPLVADGPRAAGPDRRTSTDATAADPAIADPVESVVMTRSYGEGPERVGDLHLPAAAGPHPVVVLVHGGFWREGYRRDLMDGLAVDLAGRGWAVWNVEYHRTGQDEGGWPGTFADVAAGVDHLADLADEHDLDLDRVVTAGHSAGGHLAVWAASRHRLPAGAPGADPVVRPCAAVGQAGVLDLAGADDRGVGGGAVEALLGAPARTVPDRVAAGSPLELVPLGVPVLLVHGTGDDIVPLWQSEVYADAAVRAGDDVTLEVTAGGHFAHLDVTSPDWAAVVAFLDDACR